MPQISTIEGQITEIIYCNEENGYTVCEIELQEDVMTLVGTMPGIHPGETIKATGEYKTHPTYGEQFSVYSYEKAVPQTSKAIEKYLASGVIKGIGETIAKRIVKKFKEKTLEIIEKEPERLEEIKGISLNKAQQIGEIFHEQRELRRAMLFLQDYGITPNYALKIYKKYKEKTIEVVQVNPYRLADDIHGIGFKKADHIAETMGIAKDSVHRIKSGIKYILVQASQNGHTYLPKKILEEHTIRLLEIEYELIENAIIELLMQKQIYIQTIENESRVYLMPFYYAELSVAKKIIEISETNIKIEENTLDKKILKIEKEHGINLAENQKRAVKESMEKGVLIVTGGPGTGKTTTINAIIALMEEEGYDMLLAAPTGRAAKRMTEATGREALTIHRLLENTSISQDRTIQSFQRDEDNPLEADVIIIDEVSMVDILLMNSLLKAIISGTRLILVGDVDQLPSVGPGNVLKDFINSDELPVVRLTEIFRQAQESDIVMNAHRVNQGKYLHKNSKGKDFFFMKRAVVNEVIETILELAKTRLPKFAKCSPIKDIQILTPMKKSPLGVQNLNKELQDTLNPKNKNKKEKEFRGIIYREGDKVMQIKNNYNTVWKIYNKYNYPLDEGVGVFNGDSGIITEIDTKAEKVIVTFDDQKVVEYDYNNLDELELAYAVTIHKSQGSEYPIVILPIHSGPPMLLSRNLLYTAITRAKKYVVIIGIEETIKRMIDNKREINRYSSLQDRLKEVHMQN